MGVLWVNFIMRRVRDVIEKYDSENKKDRKKVILIKWFQQHPGRRFDRMEVHQELGDKLDVGQKRVGDYLEELEEETVLQSYGNQRISYRLADDIIVPIKFQIRAGLRHIYAIFDLNRWGIAGSVVMGTTIWALLTFPFWFFWTILLVLPMEYIGPIHQSEMFNVAIAMTVWLVILLMLSYLLHRFHRW